MTKISKFLPVINNYPNFGDKMHKGANILKAKSLYDLYYKLCSHWQNPTDLVKNSKEPGTLLTKFRPELTSLNDQQQMMVLQKRLSLMIRT